MMLPVQIRIVIILSVVKINMLKDTFATNVQLASTIKAVIIYLMVKQNAMVYTFHL